MILPHFLIFLSFFLKHKIINQQQKDDIIIQEMIMPAPNF